MRHGLHPMNMYTRNDVSTLVLADRITYIHLRVVINYIPFVVDIQRVFVSETLWQTYDFKHVLCYTQR